MTKTPRRQNTVSLPPLATPLTNRSIPFVDDTCMPSCRPRFPRPRVHSVYGTSWNKTSLSDDGYQPIVEPLRRLPVRRSCPNNSQSFRIAPAINRVIPRFQSPVFAELRSTQSSAQFPSVSTIVSKLASVSLSTPEPVPEMSSPAKQSSDQSVTPDKLSPSDENLLLSLKMALCLIPPMTRFRMRCLTDRLRRVLCNHRSLAPVLWFEDDHKPLTNECTMNVVLDALTKQAVPALFPAPDALISTTDFAKPWMVQLARLLILDKSSWLFCVDELFDRLQFGSCSSNHNLIDGLDLLGLDCAFGSANGATCSKICALPIPMCIPAIQSAVQEVTVKLNQAPLHENNSLDLVSSTPFTRQGIVRGRSCSAGYLNESAEHVCHPCPCDIHPNRVQMTSTPGSHLRTNSCDSESFRIQGEVDPERLAALSNTAHLIRLLNQIIKDQNMDPRRKMKCLTAFRSAHTDVFWRRFRDEETAANYFARLQRRIDALPQPTLLNRMTNALRRRRPSPARRLPIADKSDSPL